VATWGLNVPKSSPQDTLYPRDIEIFQAQIFISLSSSSLGILDLPLKLTHKVAYRTATSHDKTHLLCFTSTSIHGCPCIRKYVVLPYANQKPCPNNSHWPVTQTAFWPSLGTAKTKVQWVQPRHFKLSGKQKIVWNCGSLIIADSKWLKGKSQLQGAWEMVYFEFETTGILK